MVLPKGIQENCVSMPYRSNALTIRSTFSSCFDKSDILSILLSKKSRTDVYYYEIGRNVRDWHWPWKPVQEGIPRSGWNPVMQRISIFCFSSWIPCIFQPSSLHLWKKHYLPVLERHLCWCVSEAENRFPVPMHWSDSWPQRDWL